MDFVVAKTGSLRAVLTAEQKSIPTVYPYTQRRMWHIIQAETQDPIELSTGESIDLDIFSHKQHKGRL